MKRRNFLAASSLPVALAACDARPQLDGAFVGSSYQRGHLLRGAPVNPSPPETRRTRVLIAGGGVAGLAAARALRLRGVEDFVMLELEDAAGGNSRGGEVHGVACPLGAHYLPVPGESAHEVQHLLEELGLRKRVAGRWVYDEQTLCHSPQERLFIHGAWQEGLLPMQDAGPDALADYRRFARLVQDASRTAAYAIPAAGTPLAPAQLELDAVTFGSWLTRQQLASPYLRWYLDYCCRDDYGAGLDDVSAWAGIHYFASRHGFQAPEPGAASDIVRDAGILTWPEGNGWLAGKLSQPLGARLRPASLVTRVATQKKGVLIDAFNTKTGSFERWQADHCILAVPLFVAARIVENAPPALRSAAGQLRYASWLVANLHIRAPLHDRPGPAPGWDNVIYGSGAGLGYVDAMHQSLQSVPGATVLTHYRALGLGAEARKDLLARPWAHWRDVVLSELSVPHPDLAAKATRMDVMRYGHAMSSPVPGIRSSAALQALQGKLPPPWDRLHFAHSDLSGYSVFEEAFTHGHRRASALADRMQRGN